MIDIEILLDFTICIKKMFLSSFHFYNYYESTYKYKLMFRRISDNTYSLSIDSDREIVLLKV